MWLINTNKLELEQTFEPDGKRYAILSHTWEDEEVTFQDFALLGQASTKKGLTKIYQTCAIARSRGLDYAWVDTCCIDKTSSAELTEAINSMFQWYRGSEVCFAFISDLDKSAPNEPALDWVEKKSYRWFSRGWTLQEMIAPRKLEFWDCEWNFRGDKETLHEQIHRVTGVDNAVLIDSEALHSFPLCRKMSWAALRNTTKVEDLAYCLLGLFNVNLPLIYGEGRRSFIRLQEEILKETSDLSLFAWTSTQRIPSTMRGLLAQSPSEFAHCRNLVRYRDYMSPGAELTVTSNGVKIEGSTYAFVGRDHVLGLDCTSAESGSPAGIGIYLKKTSSGYVRLRPHLLFTWGFPEIGNGTPTAVCVPKSLSEGDIRQIEMEDASRMYLKYNLPQGYKIQVDSVIPRNLYNIKRTYFSTMESAMAAGKYQATIFPLFISCVTFSVYYREQYLCRCCLISGIFEDSQGRHRPCAFIYTDQDPSTRAIFEVIDGSGDGNTSALLRHIRQFVTTKHSPEVGILAWKHVADRIASLTISLTRKDSRAQSSENTPSGQKHQGNVDIRDLPDKFFEPKTGHKRYVVGVNIR
ncbi:heterokaryon incompatibility protein-domain-containing protein [Xylariomycetidae sp. FL2044]|nr:heterokaryon incompatibility protein-domain-containing protein [Xylariomycetidae sp. FL2044]